MKPSTKILLGAGTALALLLAGLIVVLPRLGHTIDRAATGLVPHEGPRFTTWASTAERARERGAFSEAFVAEFVARWGAKRGFAAPTRRVRIFLFDTRDALREYGLLKHGESLENNGGYFSADEEAIALVGGDDRTLRHELTHMLVTASWGRGSMSTWFNEGLAQWHESGVEGSLPEGVASVVAGWIEEGLAIPLERLVDASPEDFKSTANIVFYLQSVTVVAWLATERPEAFERVLESERASRAFRRQAFEQAAGGTLAELEAAWRRWVLRAGR